MIYITIYHILNLHQAYQQNNSYNVRHKIYMKDEDQENMKLSYLCSSFLYSFKLFHPTLSGRS